MRSLLLFAVTWAWVVRVPVDQRLGVDDRVRVLANGPLRAGLHAVGVGTAPSRTARMVMSNVDIRPARGDADFDAAANFFVDAFWAGSTASEPVKLTAEGRSKLLNEVRADLEQRYAELVGARRLLSALLLARDGERIVGCVGLELALVNMVDEEVLPRSRGEALFKQAMDALSGRERNQVRKLPLPELAANVLEPGIAVSPLLANLAVSPQSRGTGLGRELCREVEDLAEAWGYGGLMLQVEENNEAAVGLYTALGYNEVFATEGYPAVRANAEGELTEKDVNLLALAKQIV